MQSKQSISLPFLAVLTIAVFFSGPGCYQYRVLNTYVEPLNEYRDTVLHSYAWGLVNKPKDFHVPGCDSCAGIDELTFSKNAGQSVLTLITLGIVSNITVRWKCHKPCPRIDSL